MSDDKRDMTDPRIAFGAQPAEAELTDEDIKKLDLFTQEEIDTLLPWEITLICKTPFEVVKGLVEAIRARRKEIIDERNAAS